MKKTVFFVIACALSISSYAQIGGGCDSTFLEKFQKFTKHPSAPNTFKTYNGIDDYDSLSPILSSPDVTVNLLVKRLGKHSELQTIWESGGVGAGFAEAFIKMKDNKFIVGRWNQSFSVDAPLYTKNWMMVSAVFTRSGTKFYINGELQKDVPGVYGDVATANGVHQVGRFRTPSTSGGEYFEGQVGDVTVERRAFSGGEIFGLLLQYNGTLTFNGVDDEVSLSPLDAVNTLSVSVLVKRTGNNTVEQSIWESGGSGAGFAEALIKIKGTEITAARWNEPVVTTFDPMGDWFRVTAVFTADSTSIFINSDLKATRAGNYPSIRTVNGTHQLGRFRNTTNTFFTGEMSDLHILPDSIVTSAVLATLPTTPNAEPAIDCHVLQFNGIDESLTGKNLPNMNNLTVNVWVKRTGNSLEKQTIWDNGGSGGGLAEALINIQDDQVVAARWNQPVSATVNNLDEWTMITAVYTRTSVKLYINGVGESDRSGTYPVMRTVNGTHQFGRFRGETVYFQGSMYGNQLFYNTVLSSADIQSIYAQNANIVTGVLPVEPKLSIYPNPASSVVQTEIGQLEIMDLTGATVLSVISRGQVDVSSLKPGIYLAVQNGKRTKLIIE